MLIANNPAIDLDVLGRAIEAELAAAKPQPPFPLPLGMLGLQVTGNAILKALDLVDEAARPRTALPARLNRFPWKTFSFLARFIIKLDDILFFRQRLALRQLTAAMRIQVEVNNTLIEQVNDLRHKLEGK
jgi:hypothetical protein